MKMFSMLGIVQEFSLTILIFKTCFYLLCSIWVLSVTLYSGLPIYYPASSNLVFIPSGVFFILVIIFFSFVCNSLLKLYCIHLLFSWVYWASLWSFLWTPYRIDCFSLHCLFVFLGVIISFIWNIFLCLLILIIIHFTRL